jgi:hypothetical protein
MPGHALGADHARMHQLTPTSTDDQRNSTATPPDPMRTMLFWALGLTAAVALLIGMAAIDAASAPPDDLAPGLQFIAPAMLIGLFALPLWLVVGVVSLARLTRRLARSSG